MKKCIKVPKNEPASEENPNGMTAQQINNEEEKFYKNKFQRGAMMFEDYNYDQFNKYILLNENQEYEDTARIAAEAMNKMNAEMDPEEAQKQKDDAAKLRKVASRE